MHVTLGVGATGSKTTRDVIKGAGNSGVEGISLITVLNYDILLKEYYCNL